MEKDDNLNEIHHPSVHHVLAHSYFTHFIFFLIGVSLDLVFHIKIFSSSSMAPVGFVFLILASLLIIWAQLTSKNLRKEDMSKHTFLRGPYCYTRSPTHWGLFLLMLGFGITVNGIFIVLSTVVSFLFTRFTFLKKQEKILAEKYGTHYTEYKKIVKF